VTTAMRCAKPILLRVLTNALHPNLRKQISRPLLVLRGVKLKSSGLVLKRLQFLLYTHPSLDRSRTAVGSTGRALRKVPCYPSPASLRPISYDKLDSGS
jgi:hypothetical protein